MRHLTIFLLLTLGGCRVSVEDERLPREEVAKAFKDRDDVIAILFDKVKWLEQRVDKLQAKEGAK